ncbi:hypothetical protein K8I85_04570, partial [bacterium]|nr:hypothetical protein [bacterium]
MRLSATRFLPPLLLVGPAAFLLGTFAPAASAADARPERDDRRWSLIYLLEGADLDAPSAGPVEFHDSIVHRLNRAPADSPDVPVKPASNVTQSENSVAVHPTNPNIVFTSSNATNNPVTTVYGTGVYWSTDGGATFAGNDQGPGGVGNNGDPAATISGIDGRWSVGYINSSGGMGVSYTTNLGSTWAHRTISSSGGLDKNHLEVDNIPTSAHYGNMYSSWVNLSGSANDADIEISRSTDGGFSWSSVQNISNAINAGSHNQGVNIRIGPNGEVYTCWAVYDSWPSDETAIGLNKSTDGGATWVGEARVVTNIRGHRNTSLPNTSIRRNSFPAMAVDVSGGSNDGAIYIVWTNIGVPGVNSGNADIYLAKSTDGGSTFATPVRVNQDAGTQAQWFPWIACDPVTGQLAVIFLDRRDDPSDSLTRAYMAVSNDGGATWEDFPVGDASFTPTPISGLASGYAGDYLGIAVGNGRAYPTWSDNRSGNYLCYVSPILVADPTDPNPPTAVNAASDFSTPTSIALSWTDPTTYASGDPLGDFSIDVLRDDVFLTNVDQGTEALLDGGLTDGTQYKYTLQARDDVTDSLSIAIEVLKYAGGSPFPNAPTGFSCAGDSTSATLNWTNPAAQSDGTTLDDFAGVRIYRDNTFVVELPRTAGDVGMPDSYVDSPPPGFVYTYEVSAIDNEAPVNESARVGGGDCFVGNVPAILVWQAPDVVGTSDDAMFDALSTLGESVFQSSNLFEFGPDLNAHEIVIASVGIYSNNHIIDATEGAALESFVADGGLLYLECGDCFNYDPESAGGYNIRPIFGLADGPDGSGDVGSVQGINDLVGFSFTYSGQNNFMDELQAVTSSPVLQNPGNSDILGVFEPAFGFGRSLGASFEFGGLVDAPGRHVLPVSVEDPLHRIAPRGGYEGVPLPAGPDFAKERLRVALEGPDQPAVKRAANTQAPSPVAGAAGARAGIDAVTLANTKVDLMAAYLQLLRSTGSPVMTVTPDTVAVTVLQGGGTAGIITVSNPGSTNGDLTWSAAETPGVAWLSLAPAGGVIPGNGSANVNLTFDSTSLPVGLHQTNVTVSGDDPSNPSDVVVVRMTVQGVPDISVSPDSLFFSVLPLASDTDQVTIRNIGTDVLNYSLSLATGASGSGRLELTAQNDSLTGAGRYRGNIYQVDVSVPLKKIDHYLTLPGTSKLQFFVYESATIDGSYSRIHTTSYDGAPGTGWYSSGDIDVPLAAGNFYFIGAAWLSDATYYHDAGATGVPSSVPFGSIVGSSGADSYPPPLLVSNSGGTIIHSQALEYGISADVQILSATSGALAASESTLVDVQVTGGPSAGTFHADLQIDSDDPDMASIVVPIEIIVTEGAVDAPAIVPSLPA